MCEEGMDRLGLEVGAIRDGVPSSIAVLRDRKYVWVNPAMSEISGYPESELIGQTTGILYARAEDYERVGAAVASAFAKGSAYETELLIRRKDNELRWMTVRGRLISQADPTAGSVWFMQDITGRKRAEQKILRLNALYAAISQTNQAIVHIKDRDTLFQEICRIAVECGRFRLAWVGLIDGETGEVRVVASNGPAEGYADNVQVSVEPGKPEGQKPTGRAVREDRVHVCNDFFADPSTAPWQERAREHGIRAAASCPLKLEGQVVGALTVYADEVNYFDHELTALLSDISADVSFALDNFAREDRRRRAEEELWRQEHFIHQVIDTDPNLIFVKDADGRFLLVNQAMADLHGTTPQDLIGRDSAELFPNKAEWEPHWKADREAMETRRPVVFTTLNFLGGRPRWLLVTKVPMEQPDGTVNLLGIAVDITERKLAEDKLQLMATYLETVREEEQKRIARELHDEMGSVLAALNMNVARLESKLPAEMAPLSAEVGSMAKLVAAAIQTMRHTVAKLRPSILDDAGLATAIECYLREFQSNTGIDYWLVNRLPDEEPALDGDRSATVFRMVQESLTNVAKHAQASKVTITLKEQGASLVLLVRDNGKGFDPNAEEGESFGLRGMRERALMVGGTVRIRSDAGKGTTVRLRVPMKPPASAQKVRAMG